MADSTIDFGKMKVTELRKELKSRGLPQNGDKSELVARLQATVRQDDNDITLDSDEIDSDAVLDDEDEKSQSEIILDETAENETLAEDLALADPSLSPTVEAPSQPKPQRTLKRKFTANHTDVSKANKDPLADDKKKITLNRTTSVTTNVSSPESKKEEIEEVKEESVKESTVDYKAKMENRAKRFGLPVTMTDAERKEARKIRFSPGSVSTGNTVTALPDHLEKLKKRAERFGESVSKVLIDLDNKERLEKRKQKFCNKN